MRENKIILSKENGIQFLYENCAYSGVKKIADIVRKDVELVLGICPEELKVRKNLSISKIVNTSNVKSGKAGNESSKTTIIFATIGKSEVLEELVKEGLVDIKDIKGKREVYKFSVLPEENVILIIGSDKRGTIYGLFHLSELLGVSAFVNWSNAIPKKKKKLEISLDDSCVSKEPSVYYRGFFINDEWPCFGNWCMEHFGGFNAKMYAHVFELLLRMKGNYLWPAMWSACFANDGPGLESAKLADELGVVMGLSHHEPCLRHGEEYSQLRGPKSKYGDAWNFRTNKEGITRFWRDGLKRNGNLENVITLGMRGERDSKILGEDATLKDNIDLLRDVLKVQNKLIKEEVNDNLREVPRMLALYKEVEPYYYGDEKTKGLMNCKELKDVILMLCDDNHGYLRSLPDEEMRKHKGGFGMYYHFDYHGDPVSYEWINSSYLPQVWEQMTTAYEYGVKKLWIVNVGDLGLNEIPLSYFMDLAYDFEKFGSSNINSADEYIHTLMEKVFGDVYSEEEVEELAEMYIKYTRIMHNRRPEHMGKFVYSVCGFFEAQKTLMEVESIIKECEYFLNKCKRTNKDCFIELIGYSVLAGMNLVKMWIYSGFNSYYASQGLVVANAYADMVTEAIKEDRRLKKVFDKAAGGKWKGFADAEHIGFKKWNCEERKNPTIRNIIPIEGSKLMVGLEAEANYTSGREWSPKQMDVNFLKPIKNYGITSAYIGLMSEDKCKFSVEKDSDFIKVALREKAHASLDDIYKNYKAFCKDVMSKNNTSKCVKKPDDNNDISLGNYIIDNNSAVNSYVDIKNPLKFVDIFVDYEKLDKYYETIDDLYEKKKVSSKKKLTRSEQAKFKLLDSDLAKEYLEKGYVICHVKIKYDLGEVTLNVKTDRDGIKAINASHYNTKYYKNENFEIIEGLGRDTDGVKVMPVVDKVYKLKDAPVISYSVDVKRSGKYNIVYVIEPTNSYKYGGKITFAYSINEEKVRKVNVLEDTYVAGVTADWEEGVLNHARYIEDVVTLKKGTNIINVYGLCNEIVLDKIILSKKDIKIPRSYMGPGVN